MAELNNDIAAIIATKKLKLGMTSTTVDTKDAQIAATEKKVKYDCKDLLKEDVCRIDDNKKLRAYIMCHARSTGDMSKGIKEAWQKRISCKMFK